MDAYTEELSDRLLQVCHLVLRMEESAVEKAAGRQVSVSELRLLEAAAAGGPTGRTVSELAGSLAITPASVTATVNRLEQKGLARRLKDPADRRRVSIQLTDEGARVRRLCQWYHRGLIRQLSEGLSPQEQAVLLGSLRKLGAFLGNQPSQHEPSGKGWNE